MNPKLTIEQRDEVYKMLRNAEHSMNCSLPKVLWDWLNANTEESKALTDRVGNQWREDLEHLAQLEQESKKCPECGGEMSYEHIPDLGQTWKHWKCLDCGKVEAE